MMTENPTIPGRDRLLWLLAGSALFVGLTWALIALGKVLPGTREGALQYGLAMALATGAVGASVWKIVAWSKRYYVMGVSLLALTVLLGAALAPDPASWIENVRSVGWFWYWMPLLFAMTPARKCETPRPTSALRWKILFVGIWPVVGVVIQISVMLA